MMNSVGNFYMKLENRKCSHLLLKNMFQEMLRCNKFVLFYVIIILFCTNVQVGPTTSKKKLISNKGKLCTNSCNNFIQQEVNKDDINAILELNNRLRNDVAGGNQDGQPPSAKSKRIVWDKDLARLAKEYAEQCICERSSKRKYTSIPKFPDQGQNVACFMAGPIRRSTPTFNRATYLWFSQVKHCKANKDNTCTGEDDCYDYYQFISGKNFAIGCGYALCEHNKKHKVWHYVCNYGIGVSMGDVIYKTGEPGSKCRFRDTEYPNLCVPPSLSK